MLPALRRLALLVLPACLLGAAAPTGEIRVCGGGAAISSAFTPVIPSFREETGIAVSVAVSSPAQGLVDLVQGRADVATGAISLADMVSGAATLGVSVDPSALTQTPLGKTRRVVFLNKSNPITALSKGQLKDIFTGRVTNWKAVGGNDEKIIVVWGSETPGQNQVYTERVFDGEPVSPAAVKATTYRDIVTKVMKTPGAVGINPEGYINAAVRIPDTPEIVTPIIAVTKGPPSTDVQKFLDYLVMMNSMF